MISTVNKASQQEFGIDFNPRVQHVERFWGSLGYEQKSGGEKKKEHFLYFGLGEFPLMLALTLIMFGHSFFRKIFELERRDRVPEYQQTVSCGWDKAKLGTDVCPASKYGGFQTVCFLVQFVPPPARKTKTVGGRWRKLEKDAIPACNENQGSPSERRSSGGGEGREILRVNYYKFYYYYSRK